LLLLLLLLPCLNDNLSCRHSSSRAHYQLLLLLLLLLLLWLLTRIEYPLLDDLSLSVQHIVHNLTLRPYAGILLYNLATALLLLLYHMLLLLLLYELSLLGWMNDLLYDLTSRLLYDLALGHHNLLAWLDANWGGMLLDNLLLLLLWLLRLLLD
jgi:hypothetical protein